MRHIDMYLDVVQKKKNAGCGGTGGITPSGTKVIKTNGKHDVTAFATADVQVPIPEAPTGKKVIEVTKNGVSTHDVAAFAQAEVSVAVPIPAEPSGEKVIEITANGTSTEDVKSFATAKINVNVPSTGITPQGTKEVSVVANGEKTEDVREFESVHIVTSVPEPSGTKTITENGTHDVKAFASVNVNVPTVGGSGSGSEDILAQIISREASGDVSTDAIKKVGYYGMSGTKITSAVLNNITAVGENGFREVKTLTKLVANQCTIFDSYSFYECTNLATIEANSLVEIKTGAFQKCTSLTKLKLPSCKYIRRDAFGYSKSSAASSMTTLDVLGGSIECDLSYCVNLRNLVLRDAINVSKITSGFGLSAEASVYVPDALVEQYKTATNWSSYASQIKPLSTYVEV